MIKRLVKLTIRKESADEFLRIFHGAKALILGSHGCRHLELMRDLNDERIFITFSIWDSEEDLNNYRHSRVFLDIWEEAGKLFDGEPEAYSMLHIA